MNDREILDSIGEYEQKQISPDFAGLMEKIENQTEQEREESRTQAIELMETPKKRLSAQSRRVLYTAAAALITVGLGFSLIALAVGTMHAGKAAYDSEAQYEPEYEAESCETDEPEYEAYAEYEGEMSPIEDVSNSDASSGIVADGETSDEYRDDDAVFCEVAVEQLGLTVDVPEKAFTTGRNVSPDFELLDVYDMSAAQLEANYKKGNIYLNSIWYDDCADVTEIVMTAVKDDDSQRIFNLKKAGEYTVNRLEGMYLEYSADGRMYNDVSSIEHDQVLFIRAAGICDTADDRANHLKYMTVMNGWRVEITLIEHFDVDDEPDGTEPDEIAAEHAQLMERIVESVRWNRVKSNFLSRHRSLVFFSSLAAAGTVSVAVINVTKRKKPKTEPEK